MFSLDTPYDQVASWVIENKFEQVVFLTNQSGLKRDLQIARLLKKAKIKVICQSATATNIGIDKIKMKQFLIENGFNTPPYKIASSVNQALNYAKELGFPLILKVGRLSEGRKMALVDSDEDIATYYYKNAISEPIILERFILGNEVSTIVYDNFGKPLVFPVISKPNTNYLFSNSDTRQRVYTAPDNKLQKITHKIHQVVLALAKLVNNKLFIGFDIVVDKTYQPFILEFNARMTETIRMSMILTKTNLLENLFSLRRLEALQDNCLTSKGFVADIPLPTSLIDLIHSKKLKIDSLVSISNTRITLFSENSEKVKKDLEKLKNL